MATLDIGQLISESMMNLEEQATSVSKADQYKPGEKVIQSGNKSNFTKGTVGKSDDFFKETAIKAGYTVKNMASKTYTYPQDKVLK